MIHKYIWEPEQLFEATKSRKRSNIRIVLEIILQTAYITNKCIKRASSTNKHTKRRPRYGMCLNTPLNACIFWAIAVPMLKLLESSQRHLRVEAVRGCFGLPLVLGWENRGGGLGFCCKAAVGDPCVHTYIYTYIYIHAHICRHISISAYTYVED